MKDAINTGEEWARQEVERRAVVSRELDEGAEPISEEELSEVRERVKRWPQGITNNATVARLIAELDREGVAWVRAEARWGAAESRLSALSAAPAEDPPPNLIDAAAEYRLARARLLEAIDALGDTPAAPAAPAAPAEDGLREAAKDLLDYLEVDHWCDACEAKQERNEGDWCPLTARLIALRDAYAAWFDATHNPPIREEETRA